MGVDSDPAAIRSIAVSPADVVDAYAYTQENPGEAVLRITPPFHGRMRARIHVYRHDDAELTGAVHVRPADVLESDVIEAYPAFDEVATGGRSADGEGSVDGSDDADGAANESDSTTATDAVSDDRRKHHAEAVERWQERAREALLDEVQIDTESGQRPVDVKSLG
ncbi:uncharacterized protein Nmag_0993 [Natrialba magadii ATCC 43099]|uniref:DUF8009 domain-containing protein n=1 Tax=Natrialba magadii (strain ATCC 43099 / DSM 3394 / CCM 3739 / CIP 104546 / IAM 13178 / JCM 8861 / NBRC 102185 / NCIMB 2190 / MS3) TaxID=547559 RepID=D3SQT9_NATMM|nr:hypothetical protein [Natrialba magadii]ADD04577.1 uncharacterized protein Nmag_0993 [Natrialba magadii ATCC 43099]ELY25234.1 hypothetical protein C500_17491 [Natrialba magadii ATCC 43099]